MRFCLFLILIIEIMFVFSSICLLKILNQKATVSKETIGFVARMSTILSYIKPCSTTRITIIGYSIPRLFSWFKSYPLKRALRSEIISGNMKPFKNDERFLLLLKSFFRSQDFEYLSWVFRRIGKRLDKKH